MIKHLYAMLTSPFKTTKKTGAIFVSYILTYIIAAVLGAIVFKIVSGIFNNASGEYASGLSNIFG